MIQACYFLLFAVLRLCASHQNHTYVATTNFHLTLLCLYHSNVAYHHVGHVEQSSSQSNEMSDFLRIAKCLPQS